MSAPPVPTTNPPPTIQRKSFLGKVSLPKVSSARKLFKSSTTLSTPIDPSAPPLGTLVIKVLAATQLIAKDRNGLSDPFPVIRYSNSRVTGPTIEKSLSPVWGTSTETTINGVLQSGSGPDAKLEIKDLKESRGFGRERVEIVLWDKDRVGREYLGEVSLGIEDWWGNKQAWKNGAEPPVGFSDEENKPSWHPIKSSRRNTVVTGQLLVQIGFVSSGTSPSTTLSSNDRSRILEAIQRFAQEVEGSRRESKEERVLLASPIEGVGTQPIDDHSPVTLNTIIPPHISVDDSSSLSGSEGEESDDESSSDDNSDVGETREEATSTSTEGEEGKTGYFDVPQSISPAPTSPALVLPPPVIVPTPIVDTTTPSTTSLPVPPSSQAQAQTKKKLSLPGFMKRTPSSKSVTTTSTLGKDSEQSDASNISDSTAVPIDSNGVGAVKKKKRFSKEKKSRFSAGEEGLTGGEGKSKKDQKKTSRLGRRKTKRDYRFPSGPGSGGDESDLFGLVQIEVKGASNLPRFKNMLGTGFDMDAFVVVSFGKRVFRTRVIRHSLNPVWDEKLFFPVRQNEASYQIAFNTFDWDKMTSNDHVGDVSVPLSQLLGTTVSPDSRGLYAATTEGRLVGDDFHDHELTITVSDKDRDPGDATHVPKLHIRAKFTPYDALRQQFLRTYLRLYDIDESGAFSYLEIFSMLDSLGSSLSKETILSFFTRFNKAEHEELSADEVILCLEEELKKDEGEKRTVPINTVGGGNGGMDTPGLASTALGFSGLQGGQEAEAAKNDEPSNSMKILDPGTKVLTNAEQGTVVKAGGNGGHTPSTKSGSSLEISEDNSGETVERVINIRECPLCHKPRMSSKAELDIITHMGICSSTDPRSVSRIVVGEYVTASQAQRKWFTKIISKATKGAYQLGADSANIIVQDRLTGTLQEEKMAVYVRLGIRLAYRGMGVGGGMDGARIRRMLESMSFKQGAKFSDPASVREIAPFIAFHNLNMDEALDPVSSYKTFNEFFYRKLKPSARPVADPEDPRTLVSPADCRAMFFPTIDDATRIWIKGRDFSITRLLGEKFKDKAHLYEGGSLAIFRLAPQDYHRYHSPVDGVCGPQSKIGKNYYTVNPMAIRSAIDVYGENVRLVSPINSPVFGEVMNIWVGAMMVGSICMTCKEGDTIKRGDECGYFQFGGSTILTLYPPNTVVFDSDLVQNSSNSVETLVRMGMRVGRRA